MPLFSVIIPTCKRNDLLAQCIERLKPGAQTIGPSFYEVIVSDDGPENEAAAMVRTQFPWVKYTAGPKRGPAANRNNGARLAEGQWLVFTDDDCLPDAHWLQAYADAIQQHPDCKAFEGTVLPDDWGLLKKDMAECPVNTTGGAFWSANIMVEKSLYWEIGGFDEQFKMAAQEDQDLFRRVKIGTVPAFIVDARIVHPVRIRRFPRALMRVPSQILNWMKFARKEKGWLLVISDGFRSQIAMFLKAIRNRKPKNAVIALFTIVLVIPVLLLSLCFR